LKKRRKVRGFLEENRKLVQFEIDHPEQRRPESRLEKKGLQLGAYWIETDTGKGRSLRDCLAEKGLPCVEEIQLRNHLINL
jgi:hypothetical protein